MSEESPRGEAERLARAMSDWSGGTLPTVVDTSLSRDPKPTPPVRKVGNAVVTNTTQESPKTRLTMSPGTPRGK